MADVVVAHIGRAQIEREQIPILDDDVACPLAYCSYEDVSKGYGGTGIHSIFGDFSGHADGMSSARVWACRCSK